MDVFLSWSGERSKKLAQIFNDWLNNVLPTVNTFVSFEEIEAGERWGDKIGEGLENNYVGIFFMVKENISAPWLNYEAGAISKNVENSKVIPLLHELRPEEIGGPLSQFQAKLLDNELDIYNIVRKVNNEVKDERKIKEDKLKILFEKWYPDFDSEYQKFIQSSLNTEFETNQPSEPSTLNQEEQIGEILNILRRLNREKHQPKMPPRSESRTVSYTSVLKSVALKARDYLDVFPTEELLKLKNDDKFIFDTVNELKLEFPKLTNKTIENGVLKAISLIISENITIEDLENS